MRNILSAKYIYLLLLLCLTLVTNSQHNWTISLSGFDPTYSPADFATAANGDVYLNGVKYDNGVSGYINKLYKSTNHGALWTEVNTTGLTGLGNVHTLTFSAGKLLLAGMAVNSANGAKIYTSSDNGATWALSMTGFDPTYSPADFVTAANGDVYLNGVKYDNGVNGFINKLYKSVNQGTLWTEVNTTGLTDLGNVHTLTVSGGKMLLAGMAVNSANGAKIYTSSDNGATWALSMAGFDPTYSPADFVTATNGDVYLNGVKFDIGINGYINKLYKSVNQGTLWTEVNTTGLTDLGNVHTLTLSGNKMLLGGMAVNSSNGAKIYTSDLSTSTELSSINFTAGPDIFPNPFYDRICIDFTGCAKYADEIKIMSLTGQEVVSIKSPAYQVQYINSESFARGIYLLNIRYGNSTKVLKLIKN